MNCFLPSGRDLAKYMRLGNYGGRKVESRSLDVCDSGATVMNQDRTDGHVTSVVVCSSATVVPGSSK